MNVAPPAIEIAGLSKRFGALQALDRVSFRLPPQTFHALLGENGAGKSTLVKCLMGYQKADDGDIVVGERQVRITSPREAHALGLGMVYQHFTQVPAMTVAENLALVRPDLPFFIDWRAERARIEAFLAQAPFRLAPDRLAGDLAAGEKQKLEILKQLFLERRVLILDEPTSVLTPGEAGDVLALLKELVRAGRLSVLLITHKLREVFSFADSVTVLRHGRVVGEGSIAETGSALLARLMVGEADLHAPVRIQSTVASPPADASRAVQRPRLAITDARVIDDRGREAVRGLSVAVDSGEIVGLAGVSGNGQRELVQALAGQRPLASGRVLLDGSPYDPRHSRHARPRLGVIPEEPRQNACAAGLSVAANLALDCFDRPPMAGPLGWLRWRRLTLWARALIERFGIQCQGPEAPVATLSGGNVQRLVLARSLNEPPEALVLANPCAGLDVAAVAEVYGRILAARDTGAAVLIASEDLDELLLLADRILVMFEGRVVLTTAAEDGAREAIGRAMAGG